MLSDMRGRTFLMYSTRYDEPVLFETRWAMSYLRGPVSLAELGKLLPEIDDKPGQKQQDHIGSSASSVAGFSPVVPMVSGDLEQCFLRAPIPLEEIRYFPWLVGSATVRFFKQNLGIDETKKVCLRIPVSEDDAIDWQQAEEFTLDPDECFQNVPHNSTFAPLAPDLLGKVKLRSLEKKFDDYLYHSRTLSLQSVPALKLTARPGESEMQFRKRLDDLMREKKEVEARKIRERYAKKQERLQARLEKAYARIDKEKGDVTARGIDTALSIGGAILGALFGRKKLSVGNANRAVRSMRGAGRVMKEKGDVARAEQAAAQLEQDVDALALELQEKLSALAERFDASAVDLSTVRITPRHSDIYSVRILLVWVPVLDLPPIDQKD
jgi:hypothetical protein